MRRFVFVFPGQGCQHLGMGQDIYNRFAVARDTFETASNALDKDMCQICFEMSLGQLNRIENLLPAIFTVSVAAYRVFQETYQAVPSCAAGHSLGEYAALVCSGALHFGDALKLISLRGRIARKAMDDRLGHMTIVKGISRLEIDTLCEVYTNGLERLELACSNSESQFMLSGTEEALTSAERELMNRKVQITPMLESPPFHSSLMEKFIPELMNELKNIEFRNPFFPVISNATLEEYTKDNAVELMARHLTSTVRWMETMDNCVRRNVDTLVESGPQGILTELSPITAYSFSRVADQQNISNRMGKYAEERLWFLKRCLALSVSIRNYNTDSRAYEQGVVRPYKELQQRIESYQKSHTVPTQDDLRDGLSFLMKVFATKGTPADDQKQRIEKLLGETNMNELSLPAVE